MPRIVDHDERRRELVAAALRVVTTEGFAAASVRRVAEAAGHSPGAMRHYFPRQEALVAAVLDEVTRTAAARLVPRILALRSAEPAAVVDVSCALLEELMPLDETRRTEWSVWSALIDPPVVPPELERWRRAGWTGTRHHCRSVVRALAGEQPATARSAPEAVPGAEEILASTEQLRPLTDPLAEARAGVLHAVLDGLSVQLVSQDLPAADARAVLRRAVRDLAPS